MTYLNVAETQRECRIAAKVNGLTFKKTSTKVNGSPTYAYYSRATGERLSSLLTLGTAFDRACSGELSEYNA